MKHRGGQARNKKVECLKVWKYPRTYLVTVIAHERISIFVEARRKGMGDAKQTNKLLHRALHACVLLTQR